jgi:hypothetical protein
MSEKITSKTCLAESGTDMLAKTIFRRGSIHHMVARWYGYFQTKNLNLGKFLEGLAMEHVGELYIHLVILRPFCSYLVHTFGNAVYFSPFRYVVP